MFSAFAIHSVPSFHLLDWASFSSFTSPLAHLSVPSSFAFGLVFQSSVPSDFASLENLSGCIRFPHSAFWVRLLRFPQLSSPHTYVCRKTSSTYHPDLKEFKLVDLRQWVCTSDNMSLLETYYRWGRMCAVRVGDTRVIVTCEPSK